MSIPVIAIFDVGKTNKKVLLFDEKYFPVYEESVQLPEIIDEDGFPCEDVNALREWMLEKLTALSARKDVEIVAVNFSAYGASFVYTDSAGQVIAPLYNYLKPFPHELKTKFYRHYGDEMEIALQTASPMLGSLNSGMQVYRLKHEQPGIFERTRFAFHLPQYLAYCVSQFAGAEITSIGCHTQLWDFQKNEYHRWVLEEGIDKKFPGIFPSSLSIPVMMRGGRMKAGIGLHDSSAALIPYLLSFKEPFILISTGTWCISFNPFNDKKLEPDELKQDCLSYLSYKGIPVKASRLFAGYEHEQQLKRINAHFEYVQGEDLQSGFDAKQMDELLKYEDGLQTNFAGIDLNTFKSARQAYQVMVLKIVRQQVMSIELVLGDAPVKKIFVDGGFGTNSIYMKMLTRFFPGIEVYAAELPRASALGAALVMHDAWNRQEIPVELVRLKQHH